MSALLEAGLGSAERLLGPRYLLSVLLPVLLAALASAFVALAATGNSPGDALRTWQDYDASGQLLAALTGIVALLGACYLLGLFQLPLLRVLEGYWPQRGIAGRLQRRAAARQQSKARHGWTQVKALHAASNHTAGSALAARLLVAYPPPSRLADGCLPTALGNRLRAAEYYPLERYGLDAVVIWTRLRTLLPADAAERVADARTALNATVSLLTAAGLFGTVWPIVLLASGESALAAWCLLAWPVAWVAHRAALQAGIGYGQEIRVVFDLHRLLLPRHLGLEVPSDPAQERRLWDDLSQFYQRNVPLGAGPS